MISEVPPGSLQLMWWLLIISLLYTRSAETSHFLSCTMASSDIAGFHTALPLHQLRFKKSWKQFLKAYMESGIIIYGTTQDSHDVMLRSVMQRLSDAGLELNWEKCTFSQSP